LGTAGATKSAYVTALGGGSIAEARRAPSDLAGRSDSHGGGIGTVSINGGTPGQLGNPSGGEEGPAVDLPGAPTSGRTDGYGRCVGYIVRRLIRAWQMRQRRKGR